MICLYVSGSFGANGVIVYSPVAGHPKVQKAAVFDIITPDLLSGPIAAGAEIVAVANDCLNSFPNLSPNYDIHISHSRSAFVAHR